MSSFILFCFQCSNADNQPNKYKKLGDGMVVSKVHQNDSGEYICKAYQISEDVTSYEDRKIYLKIQRRFYL